MRSARLSLLLLIVLTAAWPASAAEIKLPPAAKQAMAYIYGGEPEAALPIAHSLEKSEPEHPLGFLLEAEARWWDIYCVACQIKFGMVDDWGHGKKPAHEPYLKLADQVIALAKAQIAASDTAEMHVYAGLGWALKARVYDERDEKRNVAHAGVAARAEFLRALQLDPEMADATAGLGLYNYYVDTLSPVVKMLRFFMGIPGGNKQEGIRQMKKGAEDGVLFAVNTRYYLAKNLRTFDQQYAEALDVTQPLVDRYPRNPIFLLLAGNLNVEIGRKEKARDYFNAALDAANPDSDCGTQVKELAQSFLKSLK